MVLDVAAGAQKRIAPGTTCRITVAGSDFHCETLEPESRLQQNTPGLPALPVLPVLYVRLVNASQFPALDAIIASQRKVHHIELCETRDVESSDRNQGLAGWTFMPCALPELSWDELDTSCQFLGKEFAAPILITGMTGGVDRGRDINHNLARAAAARGIPMGVGSQRLALEDPRFAGIFDVKKEVPGVFLIGNIGAAQLVGGRSASQARDLCLRAVEMIKADALAIHVNVLQEMIQIEGDRDFRGVTARVAEIVEGFPVPVIVKEVGAGLDPRSALRLAQTGVAAIDVGGRGGTSWGWIEGLRAGDPQTLELATAFRDWGLTTGDALTMARDALGADRQTALVATGGIRTGVDVAKVIALGANMAGIGLPLFKAALKDSAQVEVVLDQILRGLRTVMMCTGSRNLNGLSKSLKKPSSGDR
jgi:isopentenyl-diphosphate delta-isomerase